MKITKIVSLGKPFTKIAINLSIATALGVAGFILPAQAQFSDDPQRVDNLPTNEIDSLTGGSFNPLELIHRANLNNKRNSATFILDTEQNLNDAAAEFRRQQQQLWNNSNSATTENPEVVPAITEEN